MTPWSRQGTGLPLLWCVFVCVRVCACVHVKTCAYVGESTMILQPGGGGASTTACHLQEKKRSHQISPPDAAVAAYRCTNVPDTRQPLQLLKGATGALTLSICVWGLSLSPAMILPPNLNTGSSPSGADDPRLPTAARERGHHRACCPSADGGDEEGAPGPPALFGAPYPALLREPPVAVIEAPCALIYVHVCMYVCRRVIGCLRRQSGSAKPAESRPGPLRRQTVCGGERVV